ncbi:MAG: hypothetical protein KFB97_11845 [Cyanobium sp. M30B3]|nr:MAG: hypothetical protein KFB97_11845 [Cyanobium sp. M30B3]
MSTESTSAFTSFQYELADQPSELNTQDSSYEEPIGFFNLAASPAIDSPGISEDPFIAATSSSEFVSGDTVYDDQGSTLIDEDLLLIGSTESASTGYSSDDDSELIIASDSPDISSNSTEETNILLIESDLIGNLVSSGDGDDLVEFLGNVSGSVVELGAGMDTAVFYGDITDTMIDLGSDNERDELRIVDTSANLDGLVIEGAGVEDVLFIGSSEYSYQGDYTWQNINDPGDERLFGN